MGTVSCALTKTHKTAAWAAVLALTACVGAVAEERKAVVGRMQEMQEFKLYNPNFNHHWAPSYCISSVDYTSGDSYRFVLMIGAKDSSAVDGKPWSISIYDKTDVNDRRFHLTLTSQSDMPCASADGGPTDRAVCRRYLSPMLNSSASGYCVEKTGKPPALHAVVRFSEDREVTQLSIAGATQAGLEPNFTPAAWILADPLRKDFPYQWHNGSDFTRSILAMFENDDEDPLTPESARARVAAAFAPIIWLGIERYDCSDDACTPSGSASDDDGEIFFTHCTGFLIAPRVVATNAHCLAVDKWERVQNGDGETTEKRVRERFAVRGWLRPRDANENSDSPPATNQERRKPPELQQLTPFLVGRAKSGFDFALLWVEEGQDAAIGATPAPLALSSDPDWPFDPAQCDGEESCPSNRLAIVGYPENNALMANFDDYCKIRDKTYSPVAEPDATAKFTPHTCDTLGGNSGSPVFDRRLRQVGAIHFKGFTVYANGEFRCAGDDNTGFEDCRNFAIPVSVIADALREAAAGTYSKFQHLDVSPPGVLRRDFQQDGDNGFLAQAIASVHCAQPQLAILQPSTGVKCAAGD